MTQKQLILNYLREFGSITPMEAFSNIGCTKLATRVGEMIEAGADIRKEMVTGVNRYGKPTKYMRYLAGEGIRANK